MQQITETLGGLTTQSRRARPWRTVDVRAECFTWNAGQSFYLQHADDGDFPPHAYGLRSDAACVCNPHGADLINDRLEDRCSIFRHAQT